jgi:DNA adenine methylase
MASNVATLLKTETQTQLFAVAREPICLVDKTIVPPIKCQGIKTKLVPFIKQTIKRDDSGYWIEPFLGSGVVLFNVNPKKAIVSDRNTYIIELYKKIQTGEINASKVRDFLEFHGEKLLKIGESYYYQMREDFNNTHNPLEFLFINRAGFNGLIRFNKKGRHNVPFCRKPERFRGAYITKIANQVDRVSRIMKDKDWTFVTCHWQETVEKASKGDYVYLDPPYIGRDTTYVCEWGEEDAENLAIAAHDTPASVALSMWKENKYRRNDHLTKCWGDFEMVEFEHFYHLGATENLRNSMTEVLAIKQRD